MHELLTVSFVCPNKLCAGVLSHNLTAVWKWVFEWDESFGEGGIELASKYETVGDGAAGATSTVILCSLCMLVNVCSKRCEAKC